MQRCPSCAREVADSAAFCGYCGAAIGGPDPGVGESLGGSESVPSYWVCPRCGVEDATAGRFCGSCGTQRVEPAAAAVVTSPWAVPQAGRQWRCAVCREVNTPDSRFCYSCGAAGSAAPGMAAMAGAAVWGAGTVPGAQVPVAYPPGAGTAPQAPAAAPPTAGSSWVRWLVVAAALTAVVIVGTAAAFVVFGDKGDAGKTGTVSVISSPSPSQSPSGEGGSTVTPSPAGEAEMEPFLQEVEALIYLSGEGMDGLIQPTAPSSPGPDAPAAIQFVIDNRTEVRQRLGNITMPDDSQARACRSAFKKAMTYALAADDHYLDWAYGRGDKGTAASDNTQALVWKTEFVDVYNGLAAQYGNGLRDDWAPTDI